MIQVMLTICMYKVEYSGRAALVFSEAPTLWQRFSHERSAGLFSPSTSSVSLARGANVQRLLKDSVFN